MKHISQCTTLGTSSISQDYVACDLRQIRASLDFHLWDCPPPSLPFVGLPPPSLLFVGLLPPSLPFVGLPPLALPFVGLPHQPCHWWEKLTCQGFPKNALVVLGSASLAQKASGNAYPPPLIVANLHPILKRIAGAGDLIDKLHSELPSIENELDVLAQIAVARREFLHMPAKVVTGKAKKVNNTKKRKRTSSSDNN